MNSFSESSPFLRVQREFPGDDVKRLSTQVDQAYIDIATKVNSRTIGISSVNVGTVTGEQWYFNNNTVKQQSIRQVYTFTAAGNIPHGLTWASVSQISARSYGSFTDGTNWYGVIYCAPTLIVGQVTFYVTPTDIVVQAAPVAPAITNGTIILEWIAQI